jgi:hypothetical protein
MLLTNLSNPILICSKIEKERNQGMEREKKSEHAYAFVEVNYVTSPIEEEREWREEQRQQEALEVYWDRRLKIMFDYLNSLIGKISNSVKIWRL